MKTVNLTRISRKVFSESLNVFYKDVEVLNVLFKKNAEVWNVANDAVIFKPVLIGFAQDFVNIPVDEDEIVIDGVIYKVANVINQNEKLTITLKR